MKKPVHSHLLGGNLYVTLWGKTPGITNTDGWRFAANRVTGRYRSLILAAPVVSGEGALRVIDLRTDTSSGTQFVRADAVITTDDCSLGMTTRDCLVAVLLHPATGNKAIVHCGRDQLKGALSNVLVRTLHALADNLHERGTMLVHLTGGISAKHFAHEKNLALVREFPRLYGWSVLHGRSERGALCLHTLVRRILEQQGVRADHITHDGLCTFEHQELGSKRAQDAGKPDKWRPNLTLATTNT